MRIAIDADLVGKNGSGNETYLRGIVSGLSKWLDPAHDALLLVGTDTTALDSISTGTLIPEIVRSPRGLAGDFLQGRILSRARADSVLASYNAPILFGGRKVTIVHDVSFRRIPETYPRILRRRIELSVARSVRVSACIVTGSYFSRRELLACFPALSEEQVVVAYGAPDDEFFRIQVSEDQIAGVQERYHLPEVFVLAVGDVQPRKNLARLAEAIRKLGVPLVVVGQSGWLSRDLENRLREPIHRLGYVPRAHLPAIYALATIFAYPSLYEGFGLPIVEAMAAGTPVVTSNAGATAEIAGDAAFLVDPLSSSDIGQAIATVMSDSDVAARLKAAGQKRAAGFSWKESGRVLLPILRGGC